VPVDLYRTSLVAVVAALIGIFAIKLSISSSILEAETRITSWRHMSDVAIIFISLVLLVVLLGKWIVIRNRPRRWGEINAIL
jgi:hypothetical protein